MNYDEGQRITSMASLLKYADRATIGVTKEESGMQKIVPHLWFDTQAGEAADFYCRIFPNSEVTSRVVLHDTPSGDAEQLAFNLNGYEFMAISAGPYFTLNPSISFMVNFDPASDPDALAHLDALWNELSNGGTVLMELGEYSFSQHYGWVQDRYGVSWQLMLSDPTGDPRPFILPSLLFTGDVAGRAEEALNTYATVFGNSQLGTVAYYPAGMDPEKAGSLMFGEVQLEGQWFTAMDSATDHKFAFNEAISLMVLCESQAEIDEYWAKLSAVPEAEQCGWLKDQFGVSWQIAPARLGAMMSEGTPEQIARVTAAFLPMKKFDIATLEAAYRGE